MTTEAVDRIIQDIPEGDLVIAREPEIVLEEAHRAAAALKRVIDGKPKKVTFNNETYLEFEDWQTVGKFYGISPRIVVTKYVEYGGVTGWEATAEAVHVASGRVVSSAEAMCLTDEEKWRARPKYEWVYHKKSGGTSVEDPGKDELIWEKGSDGKNRPKKEKLLMGEEAVPMFQLRSMAQTRAGAKAMRNALAWVVVLAGYRPTPAEELPGVVAHETDRSGPLSSDGGRTAPDAGQEDQSPLRRGAPKEPSNAGDEPARGPGDESETLRAVLCGKIKEFRDRKKMTDVEFNVVLAEEKLTPDGWHRADVAALQELVNRVARWKAAR